MVKECLCHEFICNNVQASWDVTDLRDDLSKIAPGEEIKQAGTARASPYIPFLFMKDITVVLSIHGNQDSVATTAKIVTFSSKEFICSLLSGINKMPFAVQSPE